MLKIAKNGQIYSLKYHCYVNILAIYTQLIQQEEI